MSSSLATIACVLLIAVLFRTDRRPKAASRAVWLASAWMFFAASRFPSEWLHPGAPKSAAVYMDGSPMDRAVFLLLIVAAVAVLARRRPDWKQLFRANAWIVAFLCFEAVSMLWSDYPFVSFKRWIKALGTPIMALIIMTDERPLDAAGEVFRRLAFTLLPISVLYIKYIPNLGRAYHMGKAMFTGVATQKNGLGEICLVVGMYYAWDLLLNRNRGRVHPSTYLVILPVIAWLLHMAGSATALACLAIATGLFLAARLPAVAGNPASFLAKMAWGAAVVVLLEVTVGLSGMVVSLLGRDPTLTTRVPMWHGLLGMATNPLLGAGYESFWLGDRLKLLIVKYGGLIQAHNGYLETYLNVGIAGLGLLVISILSGLRVIGAQLKEDYPYAMLRIAFVIVTTFYNWTEAAFYGVSNMWLLVFLGILSVAPVKVAVPSIGPEVAAPGGDSLRPEAGGAEG